MKISFLEYLNILWRSLDVSPLICLPKSKLRNSLELYYTIRLNSNFNHGASSLKLILHIFLYSFHKFLISNLVRTCKKYSSVTCCWAHNSLMLLPVYIYHHYLDFADSNMSNEAFLQCSFKLKIPSWWLHDLLHLVLTLLLSDRLGISVSTVVLYTLRSLGMCIVDCSILTFSSFCHVDKFLSCLLCYIHYICPMEWCSF